MKDLKDLRISIFSFEKFHGKRNIGSSKIRCHWLIKYWKEAELFKFGQKYDVVIFQKAYPLAYVEHLKDTIKILDICDPDWLEGRDIVRMIEAMDAVVTSSEALQLHISKMTDKPVVWIKDRMDLALFAKKKKHKGDAHKVVWFGQTQNAHTLRPVLKYIKQYKLKLTIIGDSESRLGELFFKDTVKSFNFIRWHDDTVQDELLRNDIVVLPGSPVPKDRYKSENKTIWANCLGLPVARYSDDLKRLLKAEERIKEVDSIYEKVRKEYDVKKSIREYKKLIRTLL